MKIFNPYRALLKRKVRLKSIGYNLAGSFYSQLWYYFPILLVICLFPGSGAAQFEIELFGKISHGNTYVDQYGFPENLTSFLKGGNSTRSMLSSEELSMECVCLLNPLFMDTVPPAIICPADITIGCTANTLPANTGSATATDTCDSAPLVVFNDVTVASPSCENEYIINRTWTATDACANTANCIQIITIEDNEAPVILCPSDISVDPDPASTPNPTPGPATYFTINNGNWNSATTWVNGNIPNADTLANETIFIRHTVNYNISSAFKNNGVLRIEPFIGTTANLIVPTAINFENLSGGRIYIQSGAYTQYRFIGGGDSGIPQSGTFKNIDGIVRIRNSRVEVAQGFTSENTGSRLFENSCLLTGQNFSISGTGTIDSLIGASISIAWHGSGNFELSSGTILFQQTRVQIAGTSGSFLLSSGFANGDIDYITLRNHLTDVTGSGKIEASSSLNVTGGLNLDAYCANEYISNGKFSGSQTPNCSLTDSYFPAMCAPTFPQDGCEAIVEYVVNATDNCSTPSVTQISGLPSGSSFPKGVTINTFVANDGCQTDTCSFTITVTDEPPAIVCPPNITLQCTSNTLPPATGTATASD